MTLISNNSQIYGQLYYSTMAFHSPPSILNELMNLNLVYLSNDYTKSITTTNVPLTANNSLSSSNDYLQSLACIDTLPLTLLNFATSIVIAFIISIMVMQVTRERCNGSKQLQFLSGLHYTTYWISNYLFDLIPCIINSASIVLAIKIMDAIRNDASIETYALASDAGAMGSLFFLLIVSSFSWCTFAYMWSFRFSSDIICFIVLFIILALAGFMDMVFTFLQLLIQSADTSTYSPGNGFVSALRYIFALVFPNVTIKRAMFDLKIRSNSYCITTLNSILLSKLLPLKLSALSLLAR